VRRPASRLPAGRPTSDLTNRTSKWSKQGEGRQAVTRSYNIADNIPTLSDPEFSEGWLKSLLCRIRAAGDLTDLQLIYKSYKAYKSHKSYGKPVVN
jgi:hypothetical protein